MALALLTTLPSRMSLRSLKWSLLLLSLLSFLVMWIHLDVCQLRRVIAAHGFSSKEIITFWQIPMPETQKGSRVL
ncbi:UDP-GalNAc:beta-1,3-N-acetylgalactosaminyltransferase 1 [Manis javanica]|nr:UDP-GalNAc:beta-1,3-N-acetylgalactosaminyltransferase 1 [Manis javanica]